jgi:branched-chain amino acid transport system ATP-binding protein
VPIAVFGAATWGLFSTLTGLVPTVLLLGVARIGSGLGRAVNEPVHGSLLSDYYAPSARAKVFATHQAANTVGAFLGPSIAGWMAQFLEARYGLGVAWRLPFIVLAIPTFTLLVLAVIYLREPPRTGRSLVAAAEPPRLRQAFRLLWGVRTLRRIMLAFPFLSFVVIGFTPLTALFYKEIFLLTPGPRGTIQSFDAPFILLGLVVGAPLIDRGLRERPRTVMRRIGLMAAALSLPIAGFASAPELWMAIVFGYATVSVAILLLAGGRAIVSLVAPPEARASAFAVFGVFALLGVTALPLSGWIGDNYDLRAGIMMLTPALVLGGLVLASAASHVTDDIARVNAGYADDPSDGPR